MSYTEHAVCDAEVGGLVFDASFDSGNASKVEQIGEDEFCVWTRRDCEGMPHENGCRTWFSFSVRGAAAGRKLAFRIHNMNSQGNLFRFGMRPVFRSLPSMPEWERCPEETTHWGGKGSNKYREMRENRDYVGGGDEFVIRFEHTVEHTGDTLYFAFCYPATYTDTIAKLAWLDAAFGLPTAPVCAPGARGAQALGAASVGADSAAAEQPSSAAADPCRGAASWLQTLARCLGGRSLPPAAGFSTAKAEASTLDGVARSAALGAALQAAAPNGPGLTSARAEAEIAQAAAVLAANSAECAAASTLQRLRADEGDGVNPDDRVYYHRELLTRSLDGRRVDLITISDHAGIGAAGEVEPPLVELTDAALASSRAEGGERARSFGGKPIFLLTSRVHPGETPAQHVFDGCLAFLLHPTDPRAAALRRRFVFKLIPMINPDGVYRGHYRSDTRGVNLNRAYIDPTPSGHPTVFAISALIRQMHESGRLKFYVDLHAHSNKRGCFLFGNALSDNAAMVDNVLYAKLVEQNCRWFDFDGCLFSVDNMARKDSRDTTVGKAGSGRVATYRMTGLTHVYTLECNYNMGKRANRLAHPHAPAHMDQNRSLSPQPPLKCLSPKYTPETWQQVGKALAIAALDILEANPCSRLGAPGTEFATGMARLRSTVTAWVRTNERKQKEKAKKLAAAAAEGGAAKRKGGGGSDEEGSDEDGGGSDADDEPVPKASEKEEASEKKEAPAVAAAPNSGAGLEPRTGESDENESPQQAALGTAAAEEDAPAKPAKKREREAPDTPLGRAVAPFWVGIEGTPLVRKGFSLKTQPHGRLASGSRVQVVETRVMLDGALRAAISLEGSLGVPHGWITLVMSNGNENVSYPLSDPPPDLREPSSAMGGGFGVAARQRAVEKDPVASKETTGGAAFVF